MGLFSRQSSFLGVDIGSTGIKIVELKKENGQQKLLTYAFSENKDGKQIEWQKEPKFAAETINKMCAEAGVVSRSAVSALPTFAVFSSVLNLANIDKKDIPSAVHWEAKKVIPLPLEEMILDWKKIEENDDREKGGRNFKILLTGAPKALVKKYVEIFKAAQISLLSLETETFSLIRSLLGAEKAIIMIVELGASTTDISIAENSIPMLSRSIDVGGVSITRTISKQSGLNFARAEQFKYDLGVNALVTQTFQVPPEIIKAISPIVNEIKYAINLYQSKNNKKIEKIVLSGGSALLPNLVNYLSDLLDIKVIIGDPWAQIFYPADLKPLLNEIGPKMSVAVGLALREME